MATVYDPVQQVFDNVIHDFKSQLKDDRLLNEISKTTNIDQVYDTTDKLQREQAKHGHLRHLSKIQPYLEGLNNYVHIIEVFVQVKPEVLALIWGPIKLLLQWASTLKQSFDAIIDTLAEIGTLLPEFRNVVKLFEHNKQIKDVLALFFKDILDFYLIALNFFSLPRWRYLFESLWPTHRNKIKIVTSHINRLTILLRNEVRLEHIQAEHSARLRALEHFERTERAHQRQEYESIRADVSPRTYEDLLNHFQGRICEGTGKWLMKDPTFTKWLEFSDHSTNLIWLQGIPGAGKTYLSSTIVDETKSRGRVAFAFLSYTSATSALSILHSLIFQLASNDDDLKTVVCASCREDLKSNLDDAVRLLTSLLSCTGPVYIIVDGVDEIDEVERGRLLNQLLAILKSCEVTKILVSSRIEADLTDILQEAAITIRVDHRNSGSIQAFVNRITRKWYKEREFLPEAQAEIEGLLAPLASNSKGMFLYAKIVLSNIKHLEMDDIRNELEVLPESLDDAYSRILTRINSLTPLRLREKARKLLGWIGCSPTPLTVLEIEQALIVNLDDIEGNAKVLANLNVLQICGPIVEVVNEYVQFVHFTVKEYLFNPRICGFIDSMEATLSLTLCCIMYLCQWHHNPEIEDEELCQNTIYGAYRLHDFAMNRWFQLVENYSNSIQSSMSRKQLVHRLQMLLDKRSNENFWSPPNLPTHPGLANFESTCPRVHKLLCATAQFRRSWLNSDFNKRESTKWTNLDPLTISDTSVRIYKQIDQLVCSGKAHRDPCHCIAIQRHYGERPFKCGFLTCPSRRDGFETRAVRDSHMKHHDRPWKCNFPSCEFAEGGFLSRKMRDDHLDYYHQETKAIVGDTLGSPDQDEIQPLMFDLVKTNNVDVFKALIQHFRGLDDRVKFEICKLAAFSGSPALLELVALKDVCSFRPNRVDRKSELLRYSIRGENIETLKFILSQLKVSEGLVGAVLPGVLKTDSEQLYEEWEKYVGYRATKSRKSDAPPKACYITSNIVRATSRILSREEKLILLWKKIGHTELLWKTYVGDTLVNVASTTCSIHLAAYLLDCGANINHRRGLRYFTPLHHAVKHNSADAAEFCRFLLLRGANPHAECKAFRNRASTRIQDEIGAKNISKWLNMTWDELVISTREEAQKAIERADMISQDGMDSSLEDPVSEKRAAEAYAGLSICS